MGYFDSSPNWNDNEDCLHLCVRVSFAPLCKRLRNERSHPCGIDVVVSRTSVRVGRESPDGASHRGDSHRMEHLCRLHVAVCSIHLPILKSNNRIGLPPWKVNITLSLLRWLESSN